MRVGQVLQSDISRRGGAAFPDHLTPNVSALNIPHLNLNNEFTSHFAVDLAATKSPMRPTESPILEVHMPHVVIIHEVDDYPAWKAVFDGAADLRKRAGEISYQLLRYDNDANRIVHFSAWSSLADAHGFFESPELVELRRKAGVKAPTFLYLREVEQGIL